MLTLLEPPSPASSIGPREINVTTQHSLQATPQLAGSLSIISPPETSSPQKPLDTPDSSKVILALERWFRARFKKTNKSQGMPPPDQLSTGSGRPVNLRLDSQSQSTEDTPPKGPPTMAAGQRVRVSVLFIGGWAVVCLTNYLSERSRNLSTGFVV